MNSKVFPSVQSRDWEFNKKKKGKKFFSLNIHIYMDEEDSSSENKGGKEYVKYRGVSRRPWENMQQRSVT